MCCVSMWPCSGTSHCITRRRYLGIMTVFFFPLLFPNFIPLCDCPECALEELRRRQTDTGQILPVKVFLIINGAPPALPQPSHWLHSRLPAAFHSLTVMNYSRRHALTRTNTCGGNATPADMRRRLGKVKIIRSQSCAPSSV